MATILTFKVKKSANAKKQHEIKLSMPATAEDTDLIVKRYGSMDRLIDRANAQFAVDCQRGCRNAMTDENDAKGAQAYAEAFVDDGRKTVRKVTMTKAQAKALKYTDEQLAAMRAAGMELI